MCKKLKVGDKVKITKPSNLSSWRDSWTREMDSYIGTTQIIDSIDKRYENCTFISSRWNFPLIGLELVEESNPIIEKVEETELSFPREMYVTDQEGDFTKEQATKQVVVAYVEGERYPYIVLEATDSDDYTGYRFAKEVDDIELVKVEKLPEFKVNSIVKIVEGASGSTCASGEVGIVISKKKALKAHDEGRVNGNIVDDRPQVYIKNQKSVFSINLEGSKIETIS